MRTVVAWFERIYLTHACIHPYSVQIHLQIDNNDDDDDDDKGLLATLFIVEGAKACLYTDEARLSHYCFFVLLLKVGKLKVES